MQVPGLGTGVQPGVKRGAALLKRVSLGRGFGPGGILEATDGSGALGEPGEDNFLTPWKLDHHHPRMQNRG